MAAGPLPGKSYSSTDVKVDRLLTTTSPPRKGVRSALSRFPTGYRPAGRLLPDPRIRSTRNTTPLDAPLVPFRIESLSVHSFAEEEPLVQFTVQRSPRLLRGFFFFHSFGEGVARSDVVPRLRFRGSCLVKSFPDVIPIEPPESLTQPSLALETDFFQISPLEIGRNKDISRPCRRSL